MSLWFTSASTAIPPPDTVVVSEDLVVVGSFIWPSPPHSVVFAGKTRSLGRRI